MSQKFGVKEVADVTLIDLVSKKPVLYMDTLKLSSLENTASSSSARGGKGNPKLLTWDYDREATMQVQDALTSMKSMALLTGNEIVTGAKNVHKREAGLVAEASATVGQTKVTVSQTIAVTTEVYAFLDGSGAEVAIVSASGSTVEFDGTKVPTGTLVTVYYKFASGASAETIKITSDAFPGYYKIVGDTVVRNSSNGVDEPFQLIIHKAKLQPGFTLTFQADGEPTVFDMNLEVFRRDADTSMIEMIKY
jgi:hypothetical protein